MISMLYIAWYSKSLLVTQTQYIWEFNIITQMILQLCKVATWHIRQHIVCCMHWFWSLKISTQFLSLEYLWYWWVWQVTLVFLTTLLQYNPNCNQVILHKINVLGFSQIQTHNYCETYIHIGGITNFWGMLLVVNELNDAVSTEQLIKWCLNQQRISILSMAYKWQIHRIGWLTCFCCPLYISL